MGGGGHHPAVATGRCLPAWDWPRSGPGFTDRTLEAEGLLKLGILPCDMGPGGAAASSTTQRDMRHMATVIAGGHQRPEHAPGSSLLPPPFHGHHPISDLARGCQMNSNN